MSVFALAPALMLASIPGMAFASMVLFAAGGLLAQAYRRRMEFDADRRAVALCGDAEGLIAGLVRVSGIARMPLRWGRAFGWLVTHPPTEARAKALVRSGALTSARAQALLAGARLDDGHFAVPEVIGNETRVFTTPFKHALSQRNAWAQLFTAVLLATTVVLLTNVTGTGAAVRGGGFAAAVLVTFAGLLVLAGRLSMAGITRLRRSLETRHGCTRARTLAFVGSSPEGAPRVYEGFHTWDIALLEADGSRLLHHGDGVRFALAAGEVVSLGWAEAPPGWFGAPAIRLDWARADGTQGVLRLSSLEPATRFGIAAANRRLLVALEHWRAAAAGRPAVAAGPDWPPPVAWNVTSQRPNEAVTPRSFMVVLVMSAIFALVACLCAKLAFDPTRAAGFADVWGSMVVAQWLLLAPVAAWRERASQATLAAHDRAA